MICCKSTLLWTRLNQIEPVFWVMVSKETAGHFLRSPAVSTGSTKGTAVACGGSGRPVASPSSQSPAQRLVRICRACADAVCGSVEPENCAVRFGALIIDSQIVYLTKKMIYYMIYDLWCIIYKYIYIYIHLVDFRMRIFRCTYHRGNMGKHVIIFWCTGAVFIIGIAMLLLQHRFSEYTRKHVLYKMYNMFE